MQEYISPNEVSLFGKNDSETIQNAIAAAVKDGCRKIIIPRYNARTDRAEWRIPECIMLPSDFTVILDNCYMVQETGFFDNMFRNEHCLDNTVTDENITVTGEGNAVLDGGKHNGLYEKTAGKCGLPSIYFNAMFHWYGVKGLKIENLNIRNQRWCSMVHLFCSDADIKNINFNAIPIAPDGRGMDFRMGCENIRLENITGRTGDDFVSFVAVAAEEQTRKQESACGDIGFAKLKNLLSDPSTHFCVRITNHDGYKIHDIDIDTVLEVSELHKKIRVASTVGIGSPIFVYKSHCKKGDDYNITVKNITARGKEAVTLNNTLKDSVISNIHTFDTNVNAVGVGYNANLNETNLENVTIENVFFGAKQQEVCCSRQLDPTEYTGSVFDFRFVSGFVTLRDVFIDKVGKAITAYGGVKVTTENFNTNVVGILFDLQDNESSVVYNGEVKQNG